MNMEFKRKMPTPQAIKEMYPITPELAARKRRRILSSEKYSAARMTGCCSS